MKSIQKFFRRYPIYLLFLGLYPVFFLWQVNYLQVPAYVILRPLYVSLGVTGLAFLASYALVRDLRKAAAVAFLFVVLFFTYGRLYDLLYGVKLFGVTIGKHLTILVVGLAVCTAVSVWIVRRKKAVKSLTWGLNLVLGFLLALSVSQLVYKEITYPRFSTGNQAPKASLQLRSFNPGVSAALPDVYYIVVDGYDRLDLLEENTGLDNRPFEQSLQKLGFILPSCTLSNYNSTILSMAATLNMDYLDNLGLSYAQIGSGNDTESIRALVNNQVMKDFQALGYQVITFKQTFTFINFPQSDLVYDFDTGSDPLKRLEAGKFEFLFAKTTLLQGIIQQVINSPDRYRNLPDWVLEWVSPNLMQGYENPLYKKYQVDHFQLDKLDTIARVPGKKFIYAHLTITHGDFASSTTGDYDPQVPQDYEGYKDQILYTNQRLLTIVKNIQEQSKTPPAIILQGDHGYNLWEKGEDDFKILNAYYLPNFDASKMDSGITPVNTFRLIFSTYFNQDLPLLPNQSIWIKTGLPDGYETIPPSCQSAK